jgi:bifunctional UDP-N-acetylglucosamine pyrophosphorylase/glucosamine-1-phosphate N-acetyltransferase
VLEGNVSMGSGSVLANLRLDEGEITSTIATEKVTTGKTKLGAMIGEHVRIGVNTSTMPGVKIGSGSMIGAGLTIAQDIPNQSFVQGTPMALSIVPNTKRLPENRDAFKKKI